MASAQEAAGGAGAPRRRGELGEGEERAGTDARERMHEGEGQEVEKVEEMHWTRR